MCSSGYVRARVTVAFSRTGTGALRASGQPFPLPLEVVDGAQPQDPRELVERGESFAGEGGIGQVRGEEAIPVVAGDPLDEPCMKRGGEEHTNTAPSSNVSIRFGLGGPLINVDGACASASHSVGYGFNLIRSGVLEIAVVGGADSPFTLGVMEGWCALRVLSQRNDVPSEACRPFSADRDGLVLGEGAGVLVLESEASRHRP